MLSRSCCLENLFEKIVWWSVGITKLMTSGRSEEVKDLLYRANNQASGRYPTTLLMLLWKLFSDPKASTSDQLRKLIEEIDATKSVNVAVRLASIYGSDALGTANYAKKEHYCKIASEFGNGESCSFSQCLMARNSSQHESEIEVFLN